LKLRIAIGAPNHSRASSLVIPVRNFLIDDPEVLVVLLLEKHQGRVERFLPLLEAHPF